MKIMVCYDGSGASRSALRVATKHAKAMDAKIYLVASMEKGTEDEQKMIQQLETELATTKEKLERDGIACETHLLVRGMTPDEDLVTYAKEQGIDEIAIGIRKRSKVGKLIFGSTAQYLILNAHCPVITVK
ncbi:universal stress protein [Desulfatitalea alkaliphila]|uniref:Universal stress protein n=1 Tax=Desulfatitalea alkaliphila TaxID=2929485 RepID=A0AA41R2U1_9BACT|nr:universal stress protein [Desulfatitalea alkaliphila]MCJ8502007.1 universal stress protein [Desulfatitalea alkaliphila]